MDGTLFIGGIILAFLLIIGIPIALPYFSYKYLNRKFPSKSYKYLAFIPILVLIHSVWTAIFPNEDFYEDDFKEVTQLEFPKNSNFIYKSATFPDHFGDYTSVFMLETTYDEVEKTKFEEIKYDRWHSPETKSAIKKTKSKISHQYSYELQSGKSYYVCLFDDNKKVLIRKISW